MIADAYLRHLERRFPGIPWREPIPVIGPDAPTRHWACRVCIAESGLRGYEIPDLPTERAEVERHIAETHVG